MKRNIQENQLNEIIAWELIQKYAKSFYRNTMYQIKLHYSVEDIASEYYCRFLEKGFLQKFDPAICSRNYYIYRGLKNFIIDLQRSYQHKGHSFSLNKTISGTTDEFGELLSDGRDFTINSETKLSVEKFLNRLPDERLCTLDGNSPLLGDYVLTAKTIVQHLLHGYSGKDIASHFYNPKSGKTLSVGRVNSLIAQIKRYVQAENLLVNI